MVNVPLNQKAEDTVAPISFIKKNGYYTVGDKIFNYKLSAMMHATRTNQDVNWVFNDSEFKNLNWREKLDVDLKILYKARAQQLRDKYDYLVLAWSGGGDSTTVLDSFLNNNIRLDEVVIYWPYSRTRGNYTPSTDTSSSNILSEWDFAIQPKLEQIKQQFPDLVVTILDMFSDDNIKVRSYDDRSLIVSHMGGFAGLERFYLLEDLLTERIEKYKNVATIYGVGPIDLALIDNWVTVWFSDGTLTPAHKTDYTNKGLPRHVEYFYWTPDFPEIAREQAHVMLDHFNSNPSVLKYLTQFKLTEKGLVKTVAPSQIENEIYRSIRKSLLYHDYDNSIFQAFKPKKARTLIETYNWLWEKPQINEFVDPWKHAVNSYFSTVDRRFFREDDPYEYKVSHMSPLLVGKISNQAYELVNNKL